MDTIPLVIGISAMSPKRAAKWAAKAQALSGQCTVVWPNREDIRKVRVKLKDAGITEGRVWQPQHRHLPPRVWPI